MHLATVEKQERYFACPDPFKQQASEAQFLVPGCGMKPAIASGCRTGPPAYVAWRPV
jgi:hypothetical protein